MISNSFIQRFLEILGESKIQIYECVYPFLTPQEPHALGFRANPFLFRSHLRNLKVELDRGRYNILG